MPASPLPTDTSTAFGPESAAPWRRCFLALAPDTATRDALAAAPLPASVQAAAPDDLHLTLAFLGAVTPAQGQSLIQALPHLARKLPPLPFQHNATWPNTDAPRVEVACYAFAPELQALLSDTHAVLRQLGLPIEARPFRPHVTLGRYPRHATPVAGQQPAILMPPTARFTAIGLYTSLRHTASQPESLPPDTDQTHARPHYFLMAHHEL